MVNNASPGNLLKEMNSSALDWEPILVSRRSNYLLEDANVPRYQPFDLFVTNKKCVNKLTAYYANMLSILLWSLSPWFLTPCHHLAEWNIPLRILASYKLKISPPWYILPNNFYLPRQRRGRGNRIGPVFVCMCVCVCLSVIQRSPGWIGLWGEGTLQHGSREVRQRSGVFIWYINRVMGQNIQKLLVLFVFASSIASILKFDIDILKSSILLKEDFSC